MKEKAASIKAKQELDTLSRTSYANAASQIGYEKLGGISDIEYQSPEYVQTMLSQLTPPSIGSSLAPTGSLTEQLESGILAKYPAIMAKLATLEADTTPEFQNAEVPGSPPAPGWLSQFATGQRTASPITREQITTPSPQQWYKTPWSVREGLSGYTEWAGGDPLADILERMQTMLPQSAPYGRGTFRPVRQWG